MTSRPPAATEPNASTTIGSVIDSGDSCGWYSRPSAVRRSFQRFSPKNVMSISRVM